MQNKVLQIFQLYLQTTGISLAAIAKHKTYNAESILIMVLKDNLDSKRKFDMDKNIRNCLH